ncbi:MAG: glucosaminidase domain-containing protein [Selenomonadaceae bacterium]|nr:glucosaminidase domain-containing protein [Selenomonadaceae bacterium]
MHCLKKITAALVIGTFAFSVSANTSEAKRFHDSKIETKSASHKSDKNFTKSIEKRFDKIDAEGVLSAVLPVIEETIQIEEPARFDVPQTVSASDASIFGTPMATQQQCVKYLTRNNPNPNLNVSAEEIVAYYYEEGMREGIRPDVAFAQALKETGFFRYGGTVTPDQNNYCGLGTTSATVKGNYFSDPKMGVRAHIQHLLAYSSTRLPSTEIVDPRYSIVRKVYGSKTLSKWSDLNGRWAVPGRGYGQEILSMFRDILVQ